MSIQDHAKWVAEKVTEAKEIGIRDGMDELKISHVVAMLFKQNENLQAELDRERMMGRGHPTSRPQSYVTGLEILLEAKNDKIAELEAQLDAVREMEVPTGYSAKFTHGWGSCLQTVKAIVGESHE